MMLNPGSQIIYMTCVKLLWIQSVLLLVSVGLTTAKISPPLRCRKRFLISRCVLGIMCHIFILCFVITVFLFFKVQLACDLRKPLILREREAHSDFLSILDKFRTNLPVCVLRGFSGTQSEAESYLDRGFYFTLSGDVVCHTICLRCTINLLFSCSSC